MQKLKALCVQVKLSQVITFALVILVLCLQALISHWVAGKQQVIVSLDKKKILQKKILQLSSKNLSAPDLDGEIKQFKEDFDLLLTQLPKRLVVLDSAQILNSQAVPSIDSDLIKALNLSAQHAP